ncbi:MAG: DUF2894 domain-containing protein [Proteobacteria bacterium]|nr:DUF2894 domain-containing protein [Pseudomonadota bacterium]
MAEDHASALERLRQAGADVAQPLRFGFVAAMARRAARHEGEARERLDARIRTLMVELEPPAMAAVAPQAADVQGGGLGALTARLVAQAAARGEAPVPGPPGAGLAAMPEPRVLAHVRRVWAGLSAERRLTQSVDALPENPGPLNSQHLLHRSLTLMREVAPGCLHRFMARVDALAALEQMQAAAAAPAPAPRGPAGGARKSARGRGKSA